MFKWIAELIVTKASKSWLESFLGYLRAREEGKSATEKRQYDLASEMVRSELQSRMAARDVLLAEQGKWYTAIVRPMFGIGLALYWNAVLIDSIFLHRGFVQEIPNWMQDWAVYILAGYFLTEGALAVGRIFTIAKIRDSQIQK